MRFDDMIPADATPASAPDTPGFELAGARRELYFDPTHVRAGIVTCGGLCPGLNDVIRGLVMVLWHRYGVRHVDGFRYGYAGLNPGLNHEVVELNPRVVGRIHQHGGTILGTSRGPQDPAVMIDHLVERGVNILFTIGGDGTLRGAAALSAEARRRGIDLAVVGVPKTIDNDISFVEASFGFQTAVAAATHAITGAHTEAVAARRGVGLVKLMGRHSGFIAAYAALATNDANFVLIPEVAFPLEGEGGFLDALEQRLDRRDHAVVVVAEGAGQEFCDAQGTDKSGNKRLGDIGPVLRQRIETHFRGLDQPANVKYIDPSYIIRSVPATPADSVYCFRLAAYAVHAAMSGRTEMIVSRWHGRFIHVPIPLAVSERQRVDPLGEMWMSVLDATGQPAWG